MKNQSDVEKVAFMMLSGPRYDGVVGPIWRRDTLQISALEIKPDLIYINPYVSVA